MLGDPWKRQILSKSSGTPFSAHSLLRRFTLCALISKRRVFCEVLGASGFVSHALASKPQFPASYSKEWKAVRPWALKSLSIVLSTWVRLCGAPPFTSVGRWVYGSLVILEEMGGGSVLPVGVAMRGSRGVVWGLVRPVGFGGSPGRPVTIRFCRSNPAVVDQFVPMHSCFNDLDVSEGGTSEHLATAVFVIRKTSMASDCRSSLRCWL